jgi:cell wall-associated NlpC family hydrolase
VTALDPRLNAFRPDLADIALKGRVEADRFVSREALCVVAPFAPLRRGPADGAMLLTEALRGEEVAVFETTDTGWAWGQLATDRYVGWIPRAMLAEPPASGFTHKVSVLRTLVFGGPDIKTPPLAALPLGARVAVMGEAEDRNARYALIAPAGAVVVQHLAAVGSVEADFVAVAERFLGTPYLWGGKTGFGIDCSGLLQVALAAAGVAAPRDTDLQEAALGEALDPGSGPIELQRGDLVFWAGHVGIMLDAEMLLHANAHHMAVAAEPLRSATERLAARGALVRCIRRLAAY